jgi:exodeoxyribonuclease V alpha subunit
MPMIEGAVERIVFRNEDNGYTVARLRTSDMTRLFREELVTIVGTLPQIAIGEILECTGQWETDPMHGRQLRVTQFTAHTPISPKALARYLGSGVIKGVGPKTAERIVEHFGEQTIAVLDLEPERLTEIRGINAAKRDAIIAGWIAQREIRNLMVFLQSHDISPALARKIHGQYGSEAIPVIQTNPYKLEQDIFGVGFKTADAIAVSLGLPRDALPRLATGIKHALTEATNDGHCYLPESDALERAALLLEVPPAQLSPALDQLIEQKEAFRELDTIPMEATQEAKLPTDEAPSVPPQRIYLAPFFYSELGVTRRIRAIQQSESSLPPLTEAAWKRLLTEAEQAQGVPLATRQRDAVRMAYSQKVSILTGGPGTGKTTTIRTLVNILDSQHATYMLAAPTGRAARRMAEATGRPASTLHRLLEYQPSFNTFARNEEHPLSCDITIVDEISMVDLILMYNLLKALMPETHLLLVGDADQLPSVGPGNVLRDLLNSAVIPTIQLTELFRQATTSQIIVAAHAIREGIVPDTTPSATGDFFFMPQPSIEATAQTVLDLVTRRLPSRYGFDPIRDIQVLAPMYKGAAGVTAINDALQQRLRRNDDSASVTSGARTFHVGDKVMQLRNDYDRGIFNGDTGIITAIDLHDALVAVEFGEGLVTYGFHELDEITLAYAVSIHRAQGSEYPALVMPLTMQHAMLLQRNLLYTAITRAKQLCVLVGDPHALHRAVYNDVVMHRNTALAERLKKK